MHTISLTREVFVEADDFRDADSPDYFGLAPGKTAGLRYAGYVKVVDVVRDAAGNVSAVGVRACAGGRIAMHFPGYLQHHAEYYHPTPPSTLPPTHHHLSPFHV